MFDQLYARWFGQRKPRRNHTRTQPLLRMPVNLTLERLEQREVLSNTQFPIGYFSLSPLVGAPGQTVTVTESVTLNDQPISASITGATWSGGNATFTTSGSSGYQAGYRVIVSGVAPYGYDGIYNITSTSNNTFVVPLANDPGTFTTAGASSVGLVPNNSAAGVNTITSASWSSSNGGAATFTTSAALSNAYVSGASVSVSGLTGAAAAYNGTYAITSTGANTFTVPLEATSLASATGLAGGAELNSVGYDYTAFQSLVAFDPTVLQVVGTADTTAFDFNKNALTNTAASIGAGLAAVDPNTTLSSQAANSTNGNTYGEVTLLQGVSNGTFCYIPNGTYSIASFQVTINANAALGTVSPLKELATSIDISGVDVPAISGADEYNSATQESLSFASGFAPVNPTSVAVPNSVAGVDSTVTVLPHAAAVPDDLLPQASAIAPVLFNPVSQAGLQSATPNTVAFTGSAAITLTDGDYGNGVGSTAPLTTIVSVTGDAGSGSTAAVGTVTATASGSATVSGSGTGSLTIVGSPTDITNTLSSLLYQPGGGYFGTTTLTVSTDNNGSGGTPGFGGVFDAATTDTRTTQITVVGLFISAIDTNKGSATAPSQFVQVFSTIDDYTIPSGVYLVGANGSSTVTTVGAITDIFKLGGFVTGNNGYLTLLERVSSSSDTNPYAQNGFVNPNGASAIDGATGGVGFGTGGTSTYTLTAENTSEHIGGARGSTGQLTTDILSGAESFLLIQSPTAPTTSGNVGTSTTTSAWNIEDSVGIGGASTTSYGAITFGSGGTTLSGSTVVPTSGYTANYVSRIASDTGYTSASWVASALTGSETASGLSLNATNSTNFGGVALPDLAAPATYAPQETVVVNDGTSNQHSQVGELLLYFSTPVTVTNLATDFTLINSAGQSIPITVTDPTTAQTTGTDAGTTFLAVTFNPGNPDVFSFGQPQTDALGNTFSTGLLDGNYYLQTNVPDISLTSDSSVLLDGAKNGVSGSTSTGFGSNGSNEVDEFWRLFGDVNGTRTVDGVDAYDFLQTQGSTLATSNAINTVTSAANVGTTATVQLGTPATVVVGQTVTIGNINLVNGETSTPYNGTFVVTAVTGTPGSITAFSYTMGSTPPAGPLDTSAATVTFPNYVWYLDSNVSGSIDVGNTTSQSAFFANDFGSTTYAGIGGGTKTLSP